MGRGKIPMPVAIECSIFSRCAKYPFIMWQVKNALAKERNYWHTLHLPFRDWGAVVGGPRQAELVRDYMFPIIHPLFVCEQK